MKIFPAVRPAYHHHYKITGVFIHTLVAYRGLQQVAMIVYPLVQIKGALYRHSL
jgi:hypothetical protein